MKKLLLSYGLAATCLLVASVASAQTAQTFNIGYDSSRGVVVCKVVTLGADVIVKTLESGSSTLSANRTFDLRSSTDATDGIDTINVYAGSNLGCDQATGGILTSFSYNSNTLSIFGGDNKDVLNGGTGGYNVLHGDAAGDDLLLRVDGEAYGDAGNDRVQSNFAAGGEIMQGDAGADCLRQLNEAAAPTTFDCGADSDTYNTPFGAGQANCESTITDCAAP